jgi:hypothetical protein
MFSPRAFSFIVFLGLMATVLILCLSHRDLLGIEATVFCAALLFSAMWLLAVVSVVEILLRRLNRWYFASTSGIVFVLLTEWFGLSYALEYVSG